MYKYTVHFEGSSDVTSDEPLTEKDIFAKAYDNIYSDPKTRFDTNSNIAQFKLLDTEEIRKCEECTEWEYFAGYGYGCFCMQTMTPIDANNCEGYVNDKALSQKLQAKKQGNMSKS